MSWLEMGDLLFLSAVLLAGTVLVYGAWLCLEQFLRELPAGGRTEAGEAQPAAEDEREERGIAAFAPVGVFVTGVALAFLVTGIAMAAPALP